MESSSIINSFYRNKTIFITGGTGFVGSCLLEKLLFATEFRKIYLLVRPKKGVSIQGRLDLMLSKVLFTYRVRNIIEQKKHLIEPIAGDICLPDMGISAEDRIKLTSESEVVIHSAASVRFNDPLSEAININVKGTQRMLNLVKECSNLKSFIYVSTDFTHSGLSDVLEEKRRPAPITFDKLIKLSKDHPEDEFNTHIWEQIKGNYPNTYCFTKCISESIVLEEGDRLNLPFAIAKPSIIFAAAREPVRGYIESADQGMAAFSIGVGVGCLHVLEGDSTVHSAICTVDSVVNSILTMAWKVSCTHYLPGSDERLFAIHGNNYMATPFMDDIRRIFEKNPSLNAIGQPRIKLNISNTRLFHFVWFFYYTCFAWFFDMGICIMGGKPQLSKVYEKTLRMFEAVKFFVKTDWKMEGNRIHEIYQSLNSKDQELYPVNEVDNFPLYFTEVWIHLKMYVLKESGDKSLLIAKRRLHIIQSLDVAVKTVAWAILAYAFFKFWIILGY